MNVLLDDRRYVQTGKRFEDVFGISAVEFLKANARAPDFDMRKLEFQRREARLKDAYYRFSDYAGNCRRFPGTFSSNDANSLLGALKIAFVEMLEATMYEAPSQAEA